MFKIISAEIKKMVSKPGVFVLAILLAIILVLGVFIYEPKVYDNGVKNIGDSLEVIYANFKGNGSTSGLKVESDNLIANSVNQIENYKINGQSYREYFQTLEDVLKRNLTDYGMDGLIPDGPNNDSDALKHRFAVAQALDNLKSEVISAIDLGKSKSYPVLSSKSNRNNFESLCQEGAKFIESPVNKLLITDRCADFTNNYMNKIFECIDMLHYPSLNDDLLFNYTSNDEKSRLTKVTTNLSEISNQIEELNTEVKRDPNGATNAQTNKMNNLCNQYISTAKTYANLVNYELLSNAFSFLGTKTQINDMYLSNESEFNANTNLIRYRYIFDNNSTETDFAHPLTIGTTSNSEKNGYDYAYFILRLFSFVIIAYAIMSACHAIAGEVKEGTMRYLAIRPVSRTKVLFGKMLAIILMSTIFAIFSTIIALIVGGVVYGLDSLTILTIFNGSTAITLHPLGMLLIYVFSMLVELTIYVSIAMLLSCLLKSDLLAVTLMLMLYLLNILIPAFVHNPTSWLAFYPFSHISIYSLFGSSVYATSNDFLNIILSAKVFTNTTLWLTLTIILVIGIVVNIISTKLFKNKEL